MCVRVCVCVCMHIRLCACMFMCINMCVHASMCMFAATHACKFVPVFLRRTFTHGTQLLPVWESAPTYLRWLARSCKAGWNCSRQWHPLAVHTGREQTTPHSVALLPHWLPCCLSATSAHAQLSLYPYKTVCSTSTHTAQSLPIWNCQLSLYPYETVCNTSTHTHNSAFTHTILSVNFRARLDEKQMD